MALITDVILRSPALSKHPHSVTHKVKTRYRLLATIDLGFAPMRPEFSLADAMGHQSECSPLVPDRGFLACILLT